MSQENYKNCELADILLTSDFSSSYKNANVLMQMNFFQMLYCIDKYYISFEVKSWGKITLKGHKQSVIKIF